MAEATESKMDEAIAEAAAEKAYAAAAETVTVKSEAPAKAEAIVAVSPVAPAKKPVAAKKAVAVKKPVAAKKAPVAPKLAKPAVKPSKLVKKAVAKKPAAKKIVKTVKQPAKVAVRLPTLAKIKDTIMTKTVTTEDFTAKVKEAVADMQERAKVAFDKSQAAFGEINEFNKGNVEALVESGKILAAGLQDMGKEYVAEGKTAFETFTADVKEAVAVKSPADFFKLQGEILRRNFDAAVAAGSKRSEAIVKLANDAYAPLSSRVSLAVEKVKQAA
jgi:phasin family protein